MTVNIFCQVTLPQTLAEDLVREFDLTVTDDKVQIFPGNKDIIEKILTEYLVSRRVLDSSAKFDELVNARINAMACLLQNLGGAAVMPAAAPPARIASKSVYVEAEKTEEAGAVDLSRKKMEKLNKISFG